MSRSSSHSHSERSNQGLDDIIRYPLIRLIYSGQIRRILRARIMEKLLDFNAKIVKQAKRQPNFF